MSPAGYVWRIEHPSTGKGPWSTRDDDGFLLVPAFTWPANKMPSPTAEGLCRDNTHVCAFPALDRLNEWFPAFTQRQLHEAGFQLKRYRLLPRKERDEVQHGVHQVLFRRSAVLDSDVYPFPLLESNAHDLIEQLPQ